MGNVNELKGFTRGQLDAALMKIGQDVGLNTADGINAFLAGELVVVRPQRIFKTFRALKLGTGPKTADDFRKAHTSHGMKIGAWGNDILGKPAFNASETEQTIELVVASVAELGFKDGANYSTICSRIRELGYDLCPNEVGPQLRLQYKDQPKGEWLVIAMEPISDSVGTLSVFLVEHDDGELWLLGNFGNPDHVWYPGRRFVFVRRK